MSQKVPAKEVLKELKRIECKVDDIGQRLFLATNSAALSKPTRPSKEDNKRPAKMNEPVIYPGAYGCAF